MKWLTVKQAAKRLSLNTDEARDLILQRLPERTARRLADGVTIGERPYASNLLNWADDEGNVFTTLNNGGTLRLGQIVVEADALVSLAQDFDCEDGDAPAKAAPTEATDFRQEGGHQDSTCDDWTVQARAIADELDAIDATAKSHDSLTNIADRVEARMRERGVHGPRGPLTGKTILREGDVAREQPIPESQTDEGHRKRRIELIEEEERARLRVRDEWQRERQGTVGEADQDSRPELTPMKRKAIIERLGRRYPALESAVDRPEEWAKACRVPKEASPDGKQGWYYLERIEAECRTRYGGAAPTPAADLSLAGQLHDINR